jgi:hypothetical protein
MTKWQRALEARLVNGLTPKQVKYFVHPANYPAISEKVAAAIRDVLRAAVADNSVPLADIMDCYVEEAHPVFGPHVRCYRNKETGEVVDIP